jgi:Zn-dependent peptidase ImmA (M78 family)
MATEQIPITPGLVMWARERAGLTLEDAVKKFPRIEDWEQGVSYPTYPQLEQLSEYLKLPIAVFFFPTPPRVPAIRETFRTLPDVEFEHIPSKIRLLLRKAKALQLNLVELTQGRNPAARLITRDLTTKPTANVKQLAIKVREYLGVTLDEQTGWLSDEVALKKWRSALLRAGIFVFKDAFKVDEFSGFCLYDEEFPIIYVNNSSAKTRQIFTFFHELAHLLFHTSGVDTLTDVYVPNLHGDAHRIEVLCNRFAAEFLLPPEAFDAAILGRQITEEFTEELAARFHVSREMVFRRFLDRGSISEAKYRKATARWNAQRQEGGQGGDYYWTKLTYLGREYVALALTQFRQNRIDETQLAEYLDTKARNVGNLEEYFVKRVV